MFSNTIGTFPSKIQFLKLYVRNYNNSNFCLCREKGEVTLQGCMGSFLAAGCGQLHPNPPPLHTTPRGFCHTILLLINIFKERSFFPFIWLSDTRCISYSGVCNMQENIVMVICTCNVFSIMICFLQATVYLIELCHMPIDKVTELASIKGDFI